MRGMANGCRVGRGRWAGMVLLVACLGPWLGLRTGAQYVEVGLRLDTNRVEVGTSTVLRAFAQVVPEERANSDRIFSWYLDALVADPGLATADFAAMQRTASDRDPKTSSGGTADGANRRGIFDTFLNRPGAGVLTAVELFSVPVKGVAPGKARFRVAAGSTVPALAADFLVAPKSGVEPLLGGIYDAARVELEVVAKSVPPTNCVVNLTAASAVRPDGRVLVTLAFGPCPGKRHTVEFRDLAGAGAWQALPGAPHNSGLVTQTNSATQRYYRVRIEE